MVRFSVCLFVLVALAVVVGCGGPAPSAPSYYQPVDLGLSDPLGSPNLLDPPLQGPLDLPPPPPEVLVPVPPVAEPVQLAPEPVQVAPVGP